jgi:hypothetical protein
MISIEDLKESLRHQLSVLIALYEDDAAALDALRHGGDGTRETGAGACVDAPPPGAAAAPQPSLAADLARADDIELCLVCFDAAIKAAERAERTRDEVQRVALAAIERAAATRRVTTALRQDLQRLLLAAGRSFGVQGGEIEARRIGELRAALRMGEASCRNADREAHETRRRAEIAISSASAALLAAVQADPCRGNPGLDPAVARAARALAERAAEEAVRSADAPMRPDHAVVVPFGRGASAAPGSIKSSE